MNSKLENKVFFQKISRNLDSHEIDFFIHVFKEINLNTNLITEFKKISSTIFYDTYQFNLEDNEKNKFSIFLNYSIHENFFKKDLLINDFFKSKSESSVSPKLIGHGSYINNISYCVYLCKKSYSFKNILTDNISLFSAQFGYFLEYYYDNMKLFNSIKLLSTKGCAKSFFDISSFFKYDNKNKINFFLKKHKKINEKIFFDFHKDSWRFFDENILSKLCDNSGLVCTGFKFNQDLVLNSENYLPSFILNNSMYRGDPALDMLFHCNLLNIDEESFLSSIKTYDTKAFERFKITYDFSWIIRLNLAYFNKLIKEFYSSSFHSSSLINAEQIYLENRARIRNDKIFSKYIDSFDDFFIEK